MRNYPPCVGVADAVINSCQLRLSLVNVALEGLDRETRPVARLRIRQGLKPLFQFEGNAHGQNRRPSLRSGIRIHVYSCNTKTLGKSSRKLYLNSAMGHLSQGKLTRSELKTESRIRMPRGASERLSNRLETVKMAAVSRILVIRLSSIGDIVHTLPAVAALAESGAEIHWAVESRFASLLAGNPYIERVVELETASVLDGARFAVAAENLVRGLLALGGYDYDAAIDFQGLVKSAIVARFSRARERVGFGEYWLREPLAGIFYTDRVAPRLGPGPHVIEMNLALAERAGARLPGRREDWQFPLPHHARDESAVASRLRESGIEDFIIVNPGGGWREKRWPPNDYAELIQRAAREFPEALLLTGGKQDETEIEHILAGAECPRARFFPSTLLEFIALARRARLMVSGDTGPMHLAAAVGTPIVAIFSRRDPLNTPERNGPFSPEDIVVLPQKPPFSGIQVGDTGYLGGVEVESVLAAMRKRLARGRAWMPA